MALRDHLSRGAGRTRREAEPAAEPPAAPDLAAFAAAAEQARTSITEHRARLDELTGRLADVGRQRKEAIAHGQLDQALALGEDAGRLNAEIEVATARDEQLCADADAAERALWNAQVAALRIPERMNAAFADLYAAAAALLTALDQARKLSTEAARYGLTDMNLSPPGREALNGWLVDQWARRHVPSGAAEPQQERAPAIADASAGA